MVLDLGKKVLVAFTDDDEDDFLFYQEALTGISSKIEVVHVGNCNSLLQYLDEHTPHLIF